MAQILARKIIKEAKKHKSNKGEKIQFSHGVAAKLINVYLKVALVTVSNTDKDIGLLHPPIDSLLLKGLKEDDKGKGQSRFEFWKKKYKRGWTKFTSNEYQTVIEKIREKLDSEKRLWKIEELWKGYRD